jgi:hypothetical protein
MRERLDEFPTQLVLTIGWIVLGLPACLYWRNSILLVLLMSWWALVISHWSAHLGWRAKRAAQEIETAQ